MFNTQTETTPEIPTLTHGLKMFDTDFSNGSHDHYKGLIPFLSSLTTEKRLRNFYKKRKNFENSF